tara:strand:- start:430 stop:696 length:267 start_codon:yes stop_codon:yes gene_type:complete
MNAHNTLNETHTKEGDTMNNPKRSINDGTVSQDELAQCVSHWVSVPDSEGNMYSESTIIGLVEQDLNMVSGEGVYIADAIYHNAGSYA